MHAISRINDLCYHCFSPRVRSLPITHLHLPLFFFVFFPLRAFVTKTLPPYFAEAMGREVGLPVLASWGPNWVRSSSSEWKPWQVMQLAGAARSVPEVKEEVSGLWQEMQEALPSSRLGERKSAVADEVVALSWQSRQVTERWA